MTHEVIFSPEALADLLTLYDDIAESGGEARAQDYTARIVTGCLGLATFPERGTRRDDLRPGLRILGFRHRATIAFHVTMAMVVIDRILHGGRDLNLAFGDDDDGREISGG